MLKICLLQSRGAILGLLLKAFQKSRMGLFHPDHLLYIKPISAGQKKLVLKAFENSSGIVSNMSTLDYNNGDKIQEKFKDKKVSISFAIDKLFPFLHGLRDANIICPEVFEWCANEETSNPENIRQPIYSILDHLEFNELAYKKLFCKENMAAYRDLQPIYEEFQNVENMSASEQRSNPGTSAKRKRTQRQKSKKAHLQWIKDAEEVPVCCKNAKGILYKTEFAAGVSQKCIEVPPGSWYTVGEFEEKGGRGSNKNWKKSIRCKKFELKTLIEKGYLPNPSTRKKKKPVEEKPQQKLYTVDNFKKDMRQTFKKVHMCTQDNQKIEIGQKLYDDFEKNLSCVLK